MFRVAILGNTVALDIYPMTQSTSPASAVFNAGSQHYRATIQPSVLPLSPWTYVLIQGSNGISHGSAVQIWINGMWTSINADSSPLAPWDIAATSSGIQVPDIYPTLKHIRFYQRTLGQPELILNAGNNCFAAMVDNDADNVWYRFNPPAPGGPTTTGPGSVEETRAQEIYPSHRLKTSYAYNSTNQVSQQQSPDGGINRFWYDLTSRLTFSQNDKQLTELAATQPGVKEYSYTQYDALGRITEVGQKATSSTLSAPDYLGQGTIDSFNGTGGNAEITNTWYDDIPAASGLLTNLAQANLRKRVAVSGYTPTQGNPVSQATYYNYDIDGNVSTLWQQIAGLGTKRIDYEFDLVSGKVNFVKYQDGQADHFYYQYDYDAENRLTNAWSGTQAMYDSYGHTSILLPDNRKLDAHYDYYRHGPLARLELGDIAGKVQGIDYAYTLQGWLKGVNGITLNNDIGGDGPAATNIAKDAFAYTLGYYNGDYTPAGGGTATALGAGYGQQSGDAAGQSLYNGNISNSTMAISSINSGAPIGYTYHYDQLNRIKNLWQHSTVTQGSPWNSPTPNFAETFSYDANGNITAATRHDGNHLMDNLSYSYNRDATTGYLTDNKLMQVSDAVSGQSNPGELTGIHNYSYDAIGNLTGDKAPSASPSDINTV